MEADTKNTNTGHLSNNEGLPKLRVTICVIFHRLSIRKFEYYAAGEFPLVGFYRLLCTNN